MLAPRLFESDDLVQIVAQQKFFSIVCFHFELLFPFDNRRHVENREYPGDEGVTFSFPVPSSLLV